MSITFNHNGAPSPPGWDDVVHGLLKDALRCVDRGDAKMAFNLIEEAQKWIERYIEEGSMNEDPLAPARGIMLSVVLGLICWAWIIWMVAR